MRKKALLGAAVTILLCAVGWTAARPFTQKEGWERAELRVLKVFSARDGDAVFRAYMVNWKGQEVIVRDTLVKTDYRVGDTAPVLVMKHKYPNGKVGPDLLSFVVVPEVPLRGSPTP
ncbi:MAG TPA: hypothetical protein VIF64_12030 [Pyrinomonadaceae bacterium]|jgi:hypothetical protein